VDSTLTTLIGDKIYVDPQNKDLKRVVLEMLHSCSPKSNKDLILESFQCDEGHIRILVATITFGMGVDCKKVYQTIHFGPAKNVESYLQERQGRKGWLSVHHLSALPRNATYSCGPGHKELHKIKWLPT